jgi:hypothetical protein
MMRRRQLGQRSQRGHPEGKRSRVSKSGDFGQLEDCRHFESFSDRGTFRYLYPRRDVQGFVRAGKPDSCTMADVDKRSSSSTQQCLDAKDVPGLRGDARLSVVLCEKNKAVWEMDDCCKKKAMADDVTSTLPKGTAHAEGMGRRNVPALTLVEISDGHTSCRCVLQASRLKKKMQRKADGRKTIGCNGTV